MKESRQLIGILINIMIKQNANIVLQKTGLYVQLAREKGYAVIQYESQGHERPLFGLNCRLWCKHDVDDRSRACGECGSQLWLFTDSVMQMLKTRVRIDLVTNRYCSIPGSVRQWVELPSTGMQELSHLQYMKAMQTTGLDADTKQCISNYYNYKLLPTPAERSYWQEYGQVQVPECLSVLRLGEQVLVVTGKDRAHSIGLLQKYGQIRQCSYSYNYLAVLCVCSENTTLLVYELCEQRCPPIYTITIDKQQDHMQYGLRFNRQCLHVLCANASTQTAKIVEISNVMAEIPNIQVVCATQCSLSQPSINQKHNTYYFQRGTNVYANHKQSQVMTLSIDSQITVYRPPQPQQQAEQSISIENTLKIHKIDGAIHLCDKDKIYFYNVPPSNQCLKLIKYEYQLGRLSSETVQLANSIREALDLPILQNQTMIPHLLYTKPAIDGCILTHHLVRQNQIQHIKTCIDL